jgi:hypothetical protein
MSNAVLNVWLRNDQKASLPFQTDKDGIAHLQLENRDSDLRMQVGTVLCRSAKSDRSWLAIVNFPTQQVLERGIVTANLCGKATALQHPGEVTVFVRPPHMVGAV